MRARPSWGLFPVVLAVTFDVLAHHVLGTFMWAVYALLITTVCWQYANVTTKRNQR